LVGVWSTFSLVNVLVIRNRVIKNGQEFIIANVYAPCGTAGKQLLWDRLLIFIQNNATTNICICGDFNSVRSLEERRD